MRKRLPLLLGVAVLLAASGLVAVLLWPGPGVSRTNFEKIRPGMAAGEVEAILGGPADNYTTGRVDVLVKIPHFTAESAAWPDARLWAGDAGAALVFFDDAGRGAAAHFRESESWEPSLLEKLSKFRHKLGL